MATIIDFQSRRTVCDEPSVELETDWAFDTAPHATAGRMVRVEMLVREDYVESVREGFMSAWGAMIRRESKSA